MSGVLALFMWLVILFVAGYTPVTLIQAVGGAMMVLLFVGVMKATS